MGKRTVASYCTTFLKPEMLHIYRQVSGLERWETFVVAKERRSEERFPFSPIELVPGVRSNFVRRFWLKYVKKEPPIVYRGEYGALANVLERRGADLMHVYFGHTGVHLLPFMRRWPKPVIVSFHGADVMPREDRPGYLGKLKELLQEAPLVMARSGSLQERLIDLGCDPGKIRMNRTGIPMEQFPVAERSVPTGGGWRFVQACRLIEKKGLDVSLRAFASFRSRYPEARFVIAGEGPMEEQVKVWAGELGIADGVELVGFLSAEELNSLYASSHFFVHPSQVTEDQNQEGVPNSMLEAMATGLPVLSTLHGGIPEAVTDSASGILVEERDVEGLAAAMLSLAADEGRWRRYGESAAAEVREKFEQRAQVAKLEAIYDEAYELGKEGG